MVKANLFEETKRLIEGNPAFLNFYEIEKLESFPFKHRAWLKDYEGNFYSIAENGKPKIKWAENKYYYKDSNFNPAINMISRHKQRLVIDFDTKKADGTKDKKAITKNIQAVVEVLKANGWGFIRSSHKGSSDYIWIEFTRDLTSKEAETFLKWICPKNAEIDLNFASDKKVFPVLYALHWRHNERELPIEFHLGQKIDYDSLELSKVKSKTNTSIQKGFKYKTAINESEEAKEITPEIKDILLNPNLFNEITEKEFDKKIFGEIDSRKTIFLVTCMRLVENLPKASDNLMINAYSGTGKDCVSEAVFGIIPEEEKEELISTTPKVLAYTRNKNLNPEATWKKVALRLEDVSNSVLNDNAFKVMSSANPNKINKAKSVWKGKIVDVEIEGKPSIIMTIANPNPSEEMLRRYPICYLDEGKNQTEGIIKRQAKYMKEGKSIDYDENIKKALSLLQRAKIKIPFSDKLVKIFSPENVIVRTHFPRFMAYIQSSCALHQFQRKKDNEGFLIAEKQDYEIATIGLKKTTSNIFMIPLTKLRKTILDIFRDNDLQRKSVDDLSGLKEIEKLNITDEWLRKQLDYLVSKSFLNKDKERRNDENGKIIPKPVFIYSYNKIQSVEIPNWEDLDKINSITTNTKITPNSSITPNSKVVNEVNEVKRQELNYPNNNKIDFSELDEVFK